MNKIAQFIKTKRKEAGLTQEEFAMDKVNTALAMFNMEAVPGRKEGRQ